MTSCAGGSSNDSPLSVVSSGFAAYCDAVDDQDLDRLEALFVPGIELRSGDVVVNGRDDATAMYADTFRRDRTTNHLVSNVEVLDYDEGRVRGAARLLMVSEREGRVMLTAGRYVFEWVGLGTKWQINRLRVDVRLPLTRLAQEQR